MPVDLIIPQPGRVGPYGGQYIDQAWATLNSQWDRSATSGTLYVVGDDDVELKFTYTPEVDCYGLIGAHLLMRAQWGDIRVETQLKQTSPSSVYISRWIDFTGYYATANFWKTHTHGLKRVDMEAGVSYEFKVYATHQAGIATMMYCYHPSYFTRLAMFVFSRPGGE